MEKDSLTDETPAAPPAGVDRDAFTLAYLATHEEACPACGYNVHRLTAPRCPECGRPLAVQVVAAIAGFTWPWLVALVSVSLAAGFGMMIAAVSINERLPDWDYQPRLFLLCVYFMCNLPLPVVALLLRRWFVRRTPPVQWWMARLMALVTVGMVICFLVAIWR